jgi:tripartite-type tricarboxylate transporter receptor subunit TctC
MRKTVFSQSLIACAIAASALLSSGPASAEYPERPITLIVPYAAGGAADVSARPVIDKLSKALGKPVVLENKPGAGTQIGVEYVARSKPDGYTLALVSGTIYMLPYTNKSLAVDPLTALAPVALLNLGYCVAITNKGLGVNTLKEFIAYGKANKGKLNFGSVGATNVALATWMNKNADLDMAIIPFGGGAPMITSLLGDQINMLALPASTVKPALDTGRAVALAVTGPDRVSTMPDVPTAAEAGLPGMDLNFWFGVLAPAGTPVDIVSKLNSAIRQAIAEPDVLKLYDQNGFETRNWTPQEFGEFLKKEAVAMRDRALMAKIQPE